MYEIFEKLLKEKGIKTSEVAKATGISPTVFSEWKKGKSNPKIDKIQKIADFFNVSIEYLTTGRGPIHQTMDAFFDELDKKYYINEETTRLAQEIYDNPELRILMSASRNLKPETLKSLVNIVETMGGGGDGFLE